MELEMTDEQFLDEADFFCAAGKTYYRQPDTFKVFEVRRDGVKSAPKKVLEGATPIDLRELDAKYRDWLFAVADAIDEAGTKSRPRLLN